MIYTTEGPLLDARLTGVPLMSAPASQSTTFYFSFSHEVEVANLNFNGLSFYAWDSNKGDTVDLWTEYYVPPLTAWKRYKKFAKQWNVFPNTEMKDVLFPTTPTNGVRLAFRYNNAGPNAVDFSVNLYNFIDQRKVDTSILAEGLDW